jgi:hypothetical protein
VRTEKLLEIQVGHLRVCGGFEKILKLLIKHNHTTVIRVLKIIVLNILVHGTCNKAPGN